MSSTGSERSCSVRPFPASSLPVFWCPARCPVLRPLLTPHRVAPMGPPQVRVRCFPARPPHLPPRLDRPTSLCGASSSRRVAAGLLCGSCSSARQFPLAFLPPVGYLPALASSGSSLHVSMSGPPTGDFHPICNAPMLGAHQRIEENRHKSRRFVLACEGGPDHHGAGGTGGAVSSSPTFGVNTHSHYGRHV